MRLHWPSFFLSAGCFRTKVYSCGYAPCIGNEVQIEGVDKSGRGREEEQLTCTHGEADFYRYKNIYCDINHE